MSKQNYTAAQLMEALNDEGLLCNAPVNHEMLDEIMAFVGWCAARTSSMIRKSECIEFSDPKDGKRYEIVVRPIVDE